MQRNEKKYKIMNFKNSTGHWQGSHIQRTRWMGLVADIAATGVLYKTYVKEQWERATF
jgi:hypothetical protein